MAAALSWPMTATTRGPCRRGSVTRTSSTQCATPSSRPTASRTSGGSRGHPNGRGCVAAHRQRQIYEPLPWLWLCRLENRRLFHRHDKPTTTRQERSVWLACWPLPSALQDEGPPVLL